MLSGPTQGVGGSPTIAPRATNWARCASRNSGVLATTCSVPIPVRRTASAVQWCTAMWSGWPVCPSGAKVSTVSGRTSSSRSATVAAPASRSTDVAAAVGVAEPVVFGDAEHAQAGGHLCLANLGQPLRRPANRVGHAQLAPGGRDADHPGAGVDRGGHQAAAEVRLVVGMGPDGHDGAQVGKVRGRHGKSVCQPLLGPVRRKEPRCTPCGPTRPDSSLFRVPEQRAPLIAPPSGGGALLRGSPCVRRHACTHGPT